MRPASRPASHDFEDDDRAQPARVDRVAGRGWVGWTTAAASCVALGALTGGVATTVPAALSTATVTATVTRPAPRAGERLVVETVWGGELRPGLIEGDDLQPGRYAAVRVHQSAPCRWRRLGAGQPGQSQVLESGQSGQTAVVTIATTDLAFWSVGCHWGRVA